MPDYESGGRGFESLRARMPVAAFGRPRFCLGSSAVEQGTHKPLVASSILARGTMQPRAPVAQLDRVSASEAEGWWFEPTRARGETIPQPAVDDEFMLRALALAAIAQERGDVPVGAVLVIGDEVAAVGFNQKEANHDPTAHAEIVALRQGAARRGGWRLTGATLYVTKEPCLMCAAACVAARIDRIVYACADPKGGGAGSVYNLVEDPRLNHRVEIVKGVREEEAAQMLRSFFRDKRNPEM
jgi:tRNA(adenine34) deaminase